MKYRHIQLVIRQAALVFLATCMTAHLLGGGMLAAYCYKNWDSIKKQLEEDRNGLQRP